MLRDGRLRYDLHSAQLFAVPTVLYGDREDPEMAEVRLPKPLPLPSRCIIDDPVTVSTQLSTPRAIAVTRDGRSGLCAVRFEGNPRRH